MDVQKAILVLFGMGCKRVDGEEERTGNYMS